MSIGILLWLLITLNAAMIFWGFIGGPRIYRYSVFSAAVFAGFAIPQLIGLSNDSGIGWRRYLPEGALDLTVMMSILCLLFLWIGDMMGGRGPGNMRIVPLTEYNPARLLQFGFALMILGNTIYQVAISSMTKEDFDSLGSQWTGSITIVIFFVTMSKYGFAIMTYMYFRTKSPAALICVIAGLAMNAIAFVTGARRADAAHTFFVLVLGLFFARKVVLPAWFLGILFVVGTLWANGVGQLRGGSEQQTFLEKLENADLLANFNQILSDGGPELTNCAMHIWCIDNHPEGVLGGLDFGLVHWKHLVHAYFPGQIFGYDLKFSIQPTLHDWPKELLSYEGPPGATYTGMADAFESFWWMGWIKFYIVGYIMGRWYNRAVRGDLWSQIAYLALMSPALHTITHHTTWLLINYIHMMIFAWPGMAWARLRLTGDHRPSVQGQPQKFPVNVRSSVIPPSLRRPLGP